MQRRTLALLAAASVLSVWAPRAEAGRVVTIRNDGPRRDVNGDYVDAHDGSIVAHGGTYYLYGEAYGNQTLATSYPWHSWPRLKVYTSLDMVSWTLQGDPLPMIAGTLWIPNVIYHEPSQKFIMWFGCGGWRTATSNDGIHFTPAGGGFASRLGPQARTDGTGWMIDDDGTAYVAFASMPAGFDEPGHPAWPGHVAHGYGHVVSIERLTANYTHTSYANVTGFFPDDFVESPSLFKRKGWYYLTCTHALSHRSLSRSHLSCAPAAMYDCLNALLLNGLNAVRMHAYRRVLLLRLLRGRWAGCFQSQSDRGALESAAARGYQLQERNCRDLRRLFTTR
jgi:hypothetical protein